MSTAEGDEQDLTRKQRREAARAERKEVEQAQAASAVRRTRLMQLGVLAVIVVAIVVGIVVATGSGGKQSGLHPGPPATNPVVTEVKALLDGIPENGNALGSPTAPVTLQYFGDLECPVCRSFTEGALKPLIEADVRTGKLRIEYRSLQTATPEPETFKTQQVAALAAGKQQKAWYYIELFYHQQGEEKSGYVTESYLQGLAKQVPGLDLSKWTSERANAELANSVTSDGQAANGYGFTGTPSFAIGKTGATAKKFEYASLTDPTSFEQAVESTAKH